MTNLDALFTQAKADGLSADELTAKLADAGCVIEGGWVAFKRTFVHDDAPDSAIKTARHIFYAGAQHLWAAITTLDPGAEMTENDTKRLDSIDTELNAFVNALRKSMHN